MAKITMRLWAVLPPLFLLGAARSDALTARAAYVEDYRTGIARFSHNADWQLPPASTTKILTAYLAAKLGKLDAVYSVSRYATTMEPTKIWLKPGWKLLSRDLVHAILLNSANDASVVLAEGISGSVPRFGKLMTSEARAMGATRSNFVNPNGLPADDHYSTARDLVTIMRNAVGSPFIREALSTKSTTIEPLNAPRRIALRSHNRMLEDPTYTVIGKTGYTRAAKRCFVGAASNGPRQVLFAVMGSRDLWGDVRELLEGSIGSGKAPIVQIASAKVLPSREHRFAEGDSKSDPEPARRATKARPVNQQIKVTSRTQAKNTYHVRVGTFRDRRQADGLRSQLARAGYKPIVERLLTNRRVSYRVTLRGFTSEEVARTAARRIGRRYQVRPHVVTGERERA